MSHIPGYFSETRLGKLRMIFEGAFDYTKSIENLVTSHNLVESSFDSRKGLYIVKAAKGKITVTITPKGKIIVDLIPETSTVETVSKLMNYIVDKKGKVVNLSMVSYQASPQLEKAVYEKSDFPTLFKKAKETYNRTIKQIEKKLSRK